MMAGARVGWRREKRLSHMGSISSVLKMGTRQPNTVVRLSPDDVL